jgi:hypothetical protein
MRVVNAILHGHGPGTSKPGIQGAVLLVALAGTVSLCLAGRVSADMSSQFGLSPRAIGMANAVSAVIDDYSAVYYNPAGLAQSSESGFTLGYFYGQPRVKIRAEGGSREIGFKSPMNVGVIGYRQALFRDYWKKNVVVALALAYPENFKAATMVRTKYYGERQWPVFGRVHDMLVMSGGMGIQVHRMAYVGVGMRFAVTYSAQDITILLRLRERSVEYQHVDINADSEVQPIAGFVVRPWERLRVAAVWRRGGAPVSLVGKGQGGAEIGDLVVPVALDLNFKDFYTPDEIAASVAFEPYDRLLVACEATYALWSDYDVPYDRRPPGNPFSDIVVPRVGLEYRLSDTARIQAGYYYQPSPVKGVQPFTQYLDADEHVLSAAGELSVPIPRLLEYPLRFRLCLQYQYLPQRRLSTVNGTTTVWGYLITVGGTVELRF